MGAGPKFMAAAYKARLWTCASTISMASPLLRDVPREIRAQKRANIGHPNGPLTRTPGASLARGPSVQSRGPLVGAIVTAPNRAMTVSEGVECHQGGKRDVGPGRRSGEEPVRAHGGRAARLLILQGSTAHSPRTRTNHEHRAPRQRLEISSV
jgi:hypothetical protein